MIVSSFALGIAIGFLFFELTGLTAGGIIVPGYIALYIEEPVMLMLTTLVALCTYGVVLLINRIAILYGRRRFLVSILVGFVLKFIIESIPGSIPDLNIELQVIGYIIPGLIANEFLRQGIVKTILALGTVSLIVYLVLKIFFYSF